MARETKVGLLVAFSFLALVGGVVGYKLYFSDEPFFSARDTGEQATQALRKATAPNPKNVTPPEAKSDTSTAETVAAAPTPPVTAATPEAKTTAESSEPPPPTPAETKVVFHDEKKESDAPPPPVPAMVKEQEGKTTAAAKETESTEKPEPPKPPESGLSLVKHNGNSSTGEKPSDPPPPMPPMPTATEKKDEPVKVTIPPPMPPAATAADKKDEPIKVTIPPPTDVPPPPAATDAPPTPIPPVSPVGETKKEDVPPKKEDVSPTKDVPASVVSPGKAEPPKEPGARIGTRIEPESPAKPKPPMDDSRTEAAPGSTVQLRSASAETKTLPVATPMPPMKEESPAKGTSVIVRPQTDVPKTSERGTPVVMSPGSGGGSARGPSQVQVVDVELYPVQQGDTYASISRARYRTENYHQALSQYNRERDPRLEFPRAGMQVYLPPAGYLEQRFGHLIAQGAPPPAAPPAEPAAKHPVTATPTASAAPPAPAATETRPATNNTPKKYRVQANDTIWNIAKTTLGKGDRWPEIHKLNRELIPDVNQLRPGIELQLPADATVP